MIRNIMSALAFIAIMFTCISCDAQNHTGASVAGASIEKPAERTALNVSVGTLCVMSYYPQAEFILSYCGEATVEVDGESRTFDANVFELRPGVWIALAPNGDYIKVYLANGTTEIEFSGEGRIFAKS